MELPLIEKVPLREDEGGILRVGNTRVSLDSVIHEFQDGATPEGILQAFDSLALADVYSVVGYYLHHRKDVDDYLARRDAEAEETRQRITASQPDLVNIRERLLARQAALRECDAASGN